MADAGRARSEYQDKALRELKCKRLQLTGDLDRKHISTSFVERQNLNIRMGLRRFSEQHVE